MVRNPSAPKESMTSKGSSNFFQLYVSFSAWHCFFIFQRQESTVLIKYSKRLTVLRLQTDVYWGHCSHSDIPGDSDHIFSFTMKPEPKKPLSGSVMVGFPGSIWACGRTHSKFWSRCVAPTLQHDKHFPTTLRVVSQIVFCFWQ